MDDTEKTQKKKSEVKNALDTINSRLETSQENACELHGMETEATSSGDMARWAASSILTDMRLGSWERREQKAPILKSVHHKSLPGP